MMGVAKFVREYPVNEIYHISLLEGENRDNEDYCINSTDLVPICNDFLLTNFFDHVVEDEIQSFSLLTVSNVILNCVSNCKLFYTNKKKKTPKTKVVAPLINTSTVTSITKNNIDPSLVPVLASVDSASTTSHLIQPWSMKFLLKQLLDSTTSTDHTINFQIHSTFTTIQVKQPAITIQVKQHALDSYYPYTDGLCKYNPTMNIRYYVIRHSHHLHNQNQADVPILSMKSRKEVYLGTYHCYL